MREYTTPLTVPLPTSGSLTDDLLSNAEEAPDAPCLARRTPQGWVDVSASDFLAEVRAVAAGLLAAGVEEGERVALLARAPLRVDPRRLRDLVRRSGQRPDLRDLVGGPGRAGSSRLRRPHRRGGDRRAPPTGCGAHGRPLPRPAVDPRRHRATGRRSTRCREGGRGRRPSSSRRAARRSPSTTGDPGLHLGHHGRPEGLRADPRQLHVRAVRHGDRASRAVRRRGRLHPALPPLAHVFARIVQVGAVRAGVRLGHSADVRRCSRTWRSSSRPSCSASPGLREGLHAVQPAGRGGGRGTRLRPGRRHRDRLQPGHRARPGRSAAARPARRVSTGWSTPAARGGRRELHVRGLRRSARSATGWATSSAASASRSSRATASPRPPGRSR